LGEIGLSDSDRMENAKSKNMGLKKLLDEFA